MNKKTVILSSVMTIAIAASLIAGSTLALFSSEDSVDISVTSGKVDVTAAVTSLQVSSNTEGDVYSWTPVSPDSDGIFTGGFTDGNAVYTPGDGTLLFSALTPGDAVKLDIEIANKSTISVRYQVRILLVGDGYTAGGAESDPNPECKLSSALELIHQSVTKKGVAWTSAWSGVIERNISTPSQEEIIIRLPQGTDGKYYQNKSCKIKISLLALQSNAKTTEICEEQGHTYDDGDKCIYCGAENVLAGDDDPTSGYYVITGAPADVTELDIPGEIHGRQVIIGKEAFKEHTELKHVILREGVVEIGESAFENCVNLANIEMPETLEKIGYGAFMDSGLTSVVIPKSVTSLGTEWGTADVNNATNSDFNKEALKWAAQAYTSLVNESQKETIGSVFANTPLTKVEFEVGSTLKIIPHGCFYGCENLTEVTFPEDVEIIGEGAFNGCNLRTVDIPDSVTTVLSSAFANNLHLNHLGIGKNVKTLGYEINVSADAVRACYPGIDLLFYQYGGLENVLNSIPGYPEVLNPAPFENCYRLVEIENRSSNVTITADGAENPGGIGKYARVLGVLGEGGASHLSEKAADEGTYTIYTAEDGKAYLVDFVSNGGTALTLPELGMGYAIHDYAFYLDADDADSTIASIDFGTEITSIGDHAFENCIGLTEVDLFACKNLTSIGDNAFLVAIRNSYDCKLKTVKIGDSVETIGACAFEYQDTLQTVYIGNCSPSSIKDTSMLKSIGKDAFDMCHRLLDVYFAGTYQKWRDCGGSDDTFSGRYTGSPAGRDLYLHDSANGSYRVGTS